MSGLAEVLLCSFLGGGGASAASARHENITLVFHVFGLGHFTHWIMEPPSAG